MNDANLQWGGDRQLCVRNTKFEIREHQNCAQRGLNQAGFASVEITGRLGATIRFKTP